MAITRAQRFGILTVAVPFGMFVAVAVVFGTMGWTGESLADDPSARVADTSPHATALTYATFVLCSTFLVLLSVSLLLSRPRGGFFRAARVVILGGIAFESVMQYCFLRAVVLQHEVMRYSVYALWVPFGVALFALLVREGVSQRRPQKVAVPEHSAQSSTHPA